MDEKFVEKMLYITMVVIFFIALFSVIIISSNGFNWSAVNIGGTVTNLGFVPYVLAIVLSIAIVLSVNEYIKK